MLNMSPDDCPSERMLDGGPSTMDCQKMCYDVLLDLWMATENLRLRFCTTMASKINICEDHLSPTDNLLGVVGVFLEPFVDDALRKATVKLAIATKNRLVLCGTELVETLLNLVCAPSNCPLCLLDVPP